jgi:hypothetical protein
MIVKVITDKTKLSFNLYQLQQFTKDVVNLLAHHPLKYKRSEGGCVTMRSQDQDWEAYY